WRMPCEWLSPFEQNWLWWLVRDSRLLVIHEGGFLVLDVPTQGENVHDQLRREFQWHRQPGALRGLLLRPLSSRGAEKRTGSRRYRRTPRRLARLAIKLHPRDRRSPRAISSRPLRGFGHEIASRRHKVDLRRALRASLLSATAPAFSAKWLN